MSILVSEREFRYFQDHLGIQIDDLFSENEIENVKMSIKQWLNSTPEKQHFEESRDLFRHFSSIKNCAFKKHFLQLIGQFGHFRGIRLAMDQVLFPLHVPIAFKELPIQDQLCFQGLKIGAILCLEPSDALPLEFSSLKPGSVFFFPTSRPFSFSPFANAGSGLFLLLVYGEEKLIYIDAKEDFHNADLKKLGYGFGDRLKNSSHPLQFIHKL